MMLGPIRRRPTSPTAAPGALMHKSLRRGGLVVRGMLLLCVVLNHAARSLRVHVHVHHSSGSPTLERTTIIVPIVSTATATATPSSTLWLEVSLVIGHPIGPDPRRWKNHSRKKLCEMGLRGR